MLNITNLYADYGGKPALEDINLTLDSGELLVVLGPSGCGKTTLLNLIAGFVPYQHGTIQLEGKKVEGPGAERGVVFQNEGLLPWRNVQENVAFGLQLAGVNREQRLETARTMLKKVGLEGAEKRFIWQLSGGQRQRVGIARALAVAAGRAVRGAGCLHPRADANPAAAPVARDGQAGAVDYPRYRRGGVYGDGAGAALAGAGPRAGALAAGFRPPLHRGRTRAQHQIRSAVYRTA